MTADVRDEIAARVAAAAVRGSQRLHPDAGHVQMMQALRSTGMSVAENAPPDVTRGHALIAMQWATVLLTEGRIDPTLVPLVCAVYDATLVPLARNELLGVLPRPVQEQTLEATYGIPITRAVATPETVTPPEPVASPPAPSPAAEAAAVVEDQEEDEDEDTVRPRRPRPPEPDWEATEGVRPPRPAVSVAVAPSITRDAFYFGVVELALDKLGPCGRRLLAAPASRWSDVEAAMLRQSDAILAVGPSCFAHVLRAWRRALTFPGPWGTFAACFALSRIDGVESLTTIRAQLEALPSDAHAHGVVAARALALSTHPELGRLARDLSRSANPVARGVGIEVLAALGALPAAELQPHLYDGSTPVLHAAMRIAYRLPRAELSPLLPTLERWRHHPDKQVALPAAVTLLRGGDTRPVDEVRAGGRLVTILGAEALELLVLGGGVADLRTVEALAALAPKAASTISALARFGHPGVWSYLTHHLDDEDVADDAETALNVLFGPLVEGKEASMVDPWRTAIGDARFDPGVRYRRGRPFGPGTVGEECASGRLCEIELDQRWAELACRAGVDVPLRAPAWSTTRAPQVAALAAAGKARAGAHPANGWTLAAQASSARSSRRRFLPRPIGKVVRETISTREREGSTRTVSIGRGTWLGPLSSNRARATTPRSGSANVRTPSSVIPRIAMGVPGNSPSWKTREGCATL